MKLSQQQINDIAFADQRLRESMSLHLAGLGMKIFPMKPNRKEPMITGWPKNASSDPEQIKEWFRKFPTMNYGIACGPSGLVVVDLDVKNGIDGIEAWKRHTVEVSAIPTFEVETPSGGMHLYYWANDVPSSTNYPSEAIDIRGDGGCVVGPGSTLANGTYLPSLPGYFPDTRDISPASEPLKILLRSRKGAESIGSAGVLTAPGVPVSTHASKAQSESLGRNLIELLKAEEGTRNAKLNKSAFEIGSLVRDGVVHNQGAKTLLLKAAEEIGLNFQEAKATIESGIEAGIEKADSLPGASSKYVPLDIIAWLSEDHPDPDTFGAGQILYKPGLIWVMGEPASGKSFVCLQWALDVMQLGKSVLWLDEEAGPRDTMSKIKALGASDELLRNHFKYLQPETRNLSLEAEDLLSLVNELQPGLIVVDSAAAILANAGIDEDKNSPVAQFMNKAILPLVKDLDHTVLVIDHKTKSKTNTNYARGASAKLGVVDMALNVELKVGFSKSKSGSFEVKVNKDRSGLHAKDTCWLVKVQVDDIGVRLEVGKPGQSSTSDKLADDAVAVLILNYIRENPGCSTTQIEDNIKGARHTRQRAALTQLAETGQILKKSKSGRSSYFANEGDHNG